MTAIFQDRIDLAKIVDSGQCFRCAEIRPGVYRFVTGSSIVCCRQKGPAAIEADCTPAEWDAVWSRYFDAGRSYQSVLDGIDPDDRFMAAAGRCGEGIRILRQDPWEMLVTFIVSQRKSIPAIRRAVEALAALCGESLDAPQGKLYAFPTAQALAAQSVGALQGCGLGYRVPYVKDAARRVASGQLDLQGLARLPDAELFAALKAVYGVGDKVADCVMLFGYSRVDRAPVDVWIRRVIDEKYAGKSPFAETVQGAGILQQYLFYYAQTHKAEFGGGAPRLKHPLARQAKA
ncbi:MAG: DNA-3-methyladenine glycosylase family protein [Faecalibacterium sp.]